MLGVFLSPHYATDHNVYLTYSEPGDGGSSLALARARLAHRRGHGEPRRTCRCCGARCRRARADSSAPQIAFSPDGQYLFLTVGDRQRMTPAQDPNQALGKILRLTLDGKPAPGNPMAGKTGAAERSADRSAARHGSGQDRAGGQHLHVPGAEPGAGGDLDAPVIARPTAWRSRPTAGCGKSSTAREAATS